MVDTIEHDWCMVMSQDCDLDWDYAWRFPKRDQRPLRNKELPSVLLCEVRSVVGGVRISEIDGDVWKRVERNQDVRYHLLKSVPPACDAGREGTSPLFLDFKRYFAVPTREVYRRCAMRSANPQAATRRAVVKTPYVEDLASRFFHYQARVALPEAMSAR